MKSKKLIAVLSAASMLGSLVVAVPASAATNENVYPSAGVQVRANGTETDGFGQYNTLDVTNTSTEADTQYEMQWGSQFAAIYKYDLSDYLDDTDVSVTVYTDDNAYVVMPYSSVPANDAAGKVAFAAFVNGNIATAVTGARTLTLTWSDLKTIADANNGEVCLVFTRNSSGQWKKYIDMNKTPYLTINSAEPTAAPTEAPTAEPTVAPLTVVAMNGETEYTDFATAISEAQDGDEIELLANVDLGNTRLDINSSITITGDGTKTITGNAAPAGVLITDGHAVTFDGVNIVASGSNNALAISKGNSNGKSDVTLIDSTVTGDIYHENGQGSFIALDNTQVDGRIYTRHANSGATYAGCAISLANGSTADAITYSSENVDRYPADSVSIDGTSDGGTITDIAVRYYTVTGETERSYDTLRISSTDGTATAALDSTITGENVSVAIQFFNIPYGVEINGITLE